MAKKRRTAAQRAATAKMIAARRRMLKGGRKSNPSKKHRAKAKHRSASRSRAAPEHVTIINPSPRKAHRAKAHRRARNPVGGFVRDFTSQLVPSAIGGLGALGVDVLVGVLPLPDAIKTGPMRPVVRVAGAAALGFGAGMVSNRRIGQQVAAGALTVVLYDTMKGILARTGIGAKIPGLSLYELPGVGMYDVGPTDQPIGYYDAGQQVGETYMLPDESTVGTYVSGVEDGVYR